MEKYRIKVVFNSPVLLGSGEGWGSVIDNDIVFDDLGLPYFPARRLKGMLKESAQEVLEMLSLSGLNTFSNNTFNQAFGESGEITGGILVFDNLYLPDYPATRAWCEWACANLGEMFSTEMIIDTFTEIKTQTAIDKDGTASDNSLRRMRVLKKGITFSGDVILKKADQEIIKLLALSCLNLRHTGTMRNKGYGEATFALMQGDDSIARNVSQVVLAELREVV